jgi:ribosomal protein L11 methylase PrmA
VLGIDIDEDVIQIAKGNARLNNVRRSSCSPTSSRGCAMPPTAASSTTW